MSKPRVFWLGDFRRGVHAAPASHRKTRRVCRGRQGEGDDRRSPHVLRSTVTVTTQDRSTSAECSPPSRWHAGTATISKRRRSRLTVRRLVSLNDTARSVQFTLAPEVRIRPLKPRISRRTAPVTVAAGASGPRTVVTCHQRSHSGLLEVASAGLGAVLDGRRSRSRSTGRWVRAARHVTVGACSNPSRAERPRRRQ